MSRQMKEGLFKIAHNTQPWWGFTLQRGHAYGLYRGVCYVSAAEPYKPGSGRIVVYEQSQTRDVYRWRRKTIHRESELGRLIIDAICGSPYDGVTFRAEPVPCLRWTAEKAPEGGAGGTWTGADLKAPHYHAMSQSRKDHYSPMPPMQKRGRTWVDQICREAMA